MRGSTDTVCALAALTQCPDNRLGQIVQPERCRTDGVAHLAEAGKNALDVRMVAERNRYEPHAARVCSSRLGQLEDPLGWERPHRQTEIISLPCKLYSPPFLSTISKSPSIFNEPLLFTVIFVVAIFIWFMIPKINSFN